MHEDRTECKQSPCETDFICLLQYLRMAPKLLITWMMNLLGEVQILLERTYGVTGVDFGDFLLTRERSRELSELAGASAAQISDLGRVFLRIVDGNTAPGNSL